MQKFNHLAVAALFVSGCGLTASTRAETIEYEFDADNFPDPVSIDNPYLPFDGGTLVFKAIADDECEISRQIIGYTGPTVAGYTIPTHVDGVAVLVVRDQEWATDAEDGECDYATAELQEDTFDFYAQQDTDSEPGDGSTGAVWYLGEVTLSLPDEGEGPACSTEGGWVAGVEEAEPGLIMLSEPASGDRYQQEFDEDNAEDWAAVLRTNGNVSIDFGDFTDCAVTREWSPLEPGAIEKKWYCHASGMFPGGLALVEEQKGKTLRVEYAGATLVDDEMLNGYMEAFPAFGALGCTDPNAP